MKLIQGQTYRGRGIVSTPVGVNTINSKAALEERGFTGVTTWIDALMLPADWPQDKRSDESGLLSTQVWVEGTWGQPDQTMPDSGSGYKIVDAWPVETPKIGGSDVPGCGSEGYSCNSWSPTKQCCDGLECRDDPNEVYGPGGPGYPPMQRCQPIMRPREEQSSAWMWWTLGVVGISGAAVLAVWTSLRKHNPIDPHTRYVVIDLKTRTPVGKTFDPHDAEALARRIRNQKNSHGAVVVREVLFEGKWIQE